MAIELAGIKLDRIHSIHTDEKADWVQHKTPGLEGNLQQNMGRSLVKVSIDGIFYGPEALNRLEKLRKVYFKKEPVDFLAEITGQAYFAQVVINQLEIVQDASEPEQFSFSMKLFEYVPPPKVQVTDFVDVDASIVSEAAAFMDAVNLPDLMGAPDIQNPLPPIEKVFDELKSTLDGFKDSATSIKELLG